VVTTGQNPARFQFLLRVLIGFAIMLILRIHFDGGFLFCLSMVVDSGTSWTRRRKLSFKQPWQNVLGRAGMLLRTRLTLDRRVSFCYVA